jgi:hypothetical protein
LARDWPTGRGSVFASRGHDASAISRALKAGDLRRIAVGVYTADRFSSPESLVAANTYKLIASYAPGAVLVDRSAFGSPVTGGEVFIATNARKSDIELPGLVVRVRPGGRIDSDLAWSDGLALSGRGRAVLDNLVPTRGSGAKQARTLRMSELTDELASLATRNDAGYLERLSDEVEEVAAQLGHPLERMHQAQAVIGGLVGRVPLPETAGVAARGYGTQAADADRVKMFDALADHLAGLEELRLGAGAGDGTPTQAFYEAYLSNYIEGTIFTLEEAREIIESGKPPTIRPEDGHDILGTYSVVSDPIGRSSVPSDSVEFIDWLRARHQEVLRGRPALGPGELKTRPNQAGSYAFVRPEHVIGTLQAGYGYTEQLAAGWPRALMTMFVVSEVHPFNDGNGRIARVMMNAELSSAGLARVLVPVRWRDEYMGALRGVSQGMQAHRYVRVMEMAWRWTASIDFRDPATARGQLEATNALIDPRDGDEQGKALIIL